MADRYALLLAFGGVLFAVLLTGAGGKARQWTGLGRGWSLALVGALLAGAIALPAALIGPSLAERFGQLGETLTQGVSEVRAYRAERAWGRHLVAGVSQRMQAGANVLGTAANLLMGAGDALLALPVGRARPCGSTTDARATAGARWRAHAAGNPGCPAHRRRGTRSATG